MLVGARLFLTLYISIAISETWVVLIFLVVSGRRQTLFCIPFLRHVLEGGLFSCLVRQDGRLIDGQLS